MILLTQSLISSYLYQFQCMDGYEEQAHQSFLATLNRIPSETTPAMQRGNDFEKLVYDACDGTADVTNKWYESAKEISGYVQGARRQFVGKKRTTIGGIDLLLLS